LPLIATDNNHVRDDNKQIIDLCENATGGIFKLLDSACKAPNATGKAFCSGLHEAHGKKSAAVFGAPKMGKAEKRGKEDHFLVKHFAGEVIYFAGDEKEPGTLS
jgi:myosin heavy subunit